MDNLLWTLLHLCLEQQTKQWFYSSPFPCWHTVAIYPVDAIAMCRWTTWHNKYIKHNYFSSPFQTEMRAGNKMFDGLEVFRKVIGHCLNILLFHMFSIKAKAKAKEKTDIKSYEVVLKKIRYPNIVLILTWVILMSLRSLFWPSWKFSTTCFFCFFLSVRLQCCKQPLCFSWALFTYIYFDWLNYI